MIPVNFSFVSLLYKTDMIKLLKIYLKFRLANYGFFLGLSGLATLVGPDRNYCIKLAIGVTIGCILLGDRLINGLKSLLLWTDNYFEDNIYRVIKNVNYEK